MKCIHLNIRGAIFIILIFLLNGVKQSQLDNRMDLSTKDATQKPSKTDELVGQGIEDKSIPCPSNKEKQCSELNYPCITCNLNTSCIYGEEMNTTCTVRKEVICKEPKEFQRTLICRYCYQTEPWEHSCTLKANCNSVATPRQYYKTNCSVRNDIICLGQRTFSKKVLCNWTGGYRWSTALILSITLGGFGADRFYLGHWQEAIGKLFSFGGLGVWTLIDVILISLHYLGPADGSLYLY